MLFIRVDMNPIIATGHLMRCLAIAEKAVEMGESVTFISADGYPTELVHSKGFELIVLGTDWQNMDSELEQMKELIEKNAIKTLLIDSYQVTERYLNELNSRTKVYYIDDLNTIRHYVTGVINYACYAVDMKYNDPTAKLYLGCSYAPLRGMFRNCGKREITEKPQRVLVMSGGTDPCDMLRRMLAAFHEKLPDRYSEIIFICGRYYSAQKQLEALAESYGDSFAKRIRILSAVENMREYLERADIVVSAGGTTMYEVCATGVPTISFSLADNQLQNVAWLDEHKIVPCAGDARNDGVEYKVMELLKNYDDADVLQGYSDRMQALVDGNGTERLVSILLNR